MKKMPLCRVLLGVFYIAAISGCATIDRDIYPRFDGLYYKQYNVFTMYFRFFDDGRVINANTDGRYDYSITEWFNVNFTENQGTYTVDKDRLTFFVESEEGKVEFEGKIKNIEKPDAKPKRDKLSLKMNSLIKKHREIIEFKFLAGV